MKTIFVVLAVLGAAQALKLPGVPTLPGGPTLPGAVVITPITSALFGAFSDFKNKSPADKLTAATELLVNCKWTGIAAEEIVANLDGHASSDVPQEYTTGITCMSAFSTQQLLDIFLKTKPSADADAEDRPVEDIPATRQTAPTSVDWRTKGYVSAVQNQGQCGSCWTFSATGAIEGAIYKKTNVLQNFSEQNLVDCVRNFPGGSDGCNGGWMIDAYNYTKVNGGFDKEASYAYKGNQSTCAYSAANSAGFVTSWAYTKQNDEADLKAKLATIGPMAIGIDATNWSNYAGGVFKCSATTAPQINHGVLLVGYGTDATLGDYYIVKNSWGTSWGENGYIRLARNKGNNAACGVPQYANYPIA